MCLNSNKECVIVKLKNLLRNQLAEPLFNGNVAFYFSSPFVLDEFKRKYSNEDTLTVAVPHFWEHFDREGYSIWYAEYRFPAELTQSFMSCNLITGKLARGQMT